jgi:hypothetical protein
MRALERLILAAGLVTVGFLLWRFDAKSVWGMVSQVGFAGAASILSFQIFDHLLNALGWRYAFSAADARKAPLSRLILVRIAGDGVNYLTPSGTIAGEFVRPAMLGGELPAEVRNSSVVVAKFSQAMGQALFIILGLIFVLQGKLNFLEGRQRAYAIAAALVIMASVGSALWFALWFLTAEGAPGFLRRFESLDAVRASMRDYLKRHPLRYALSIVFFMGGYAWGAAEVLIICHFMGIAIAVKTALAVEVLSNVIDAVMFMVPAKVGTQEAGKTAIFHGLGYAASQGLAFGLIRHTREVCWAAFGFAYYVLTRRREPAASDPRRPA